MYRNTPAFSAERKETVVQSRKTPQMRGFVLQFKKWLLDFALSKAWAGKVKKVNN